MIVKCHIEGTLTRINRLYLASADVRLGLYFSKLAMLELCGWIEITMDDMVRSLSKRMVRNVGNRNYYEKEFIKRTHGFEYEYHFRRMLIGLVGLHGVEEIERKVNSAVFQPMCAALNTLKPDRDKHAHEYIKGTTLRLDAPSIIITRYKVVHAGLVNVEQVLKSLK